MKTVWGLVSGMVVALALAPVAQAEWAKHDVPEFAFSASFPKVPERETSTENGVTLNTYAAVLDGAMCLVMAADYPYVINPDEETIASRDNFAKGISGKVTTSKRTKYARGATQLEAMEFDAVSDTYTFRSLIVIEGSRAYMVAGGVPNADTDKAELEACLRGFALTPK